MLLLSCLFLVVLFILGYALKGDKGKHTVHARRNKSMAVNQAQSINTFASSFVIFSVFANSHNTDALPAILPSQYALSNFCSSVGTSAFAVPSDKNTMLRSKRTFIDYGSLPDGSSAVEF